MIDYILKISKKARHARITIYPDSRVVVTKPYGVSDSVVDTFIQQKSQWILKKLEKFKGVSADFLRVRKSSKKEYTKHKKDALVFVTKKIIEFNAIYGYKYGRISIKNQKTRWGSCSKKGNLNFNYRILFLSERLADYIIVHEICHLGELNHSRDFWDLVGRAFPGYREARRELRGNKFTYF